MIFLDEPTIGLDVLAAEKLRDFLKVFNQREKATIILTSHNMDDIERLCSRVLIMKTGELIFDGAPTKLTREGECRLRVRLKEPFKPEDLATLTGVPLSSITSVAGEEIEGEENEDAGTGAIPTFYFETQKESVVRILQALMGRATIL